MEEQFRNFFSAFLPSTIATRENDTRISGRVTVENRSTRGRGVIKGKSARLEMAPHSRSLGWMNSRAYLLDDHCALLRRMDSIL